MKKVDLVYLWCDGEEEKFIERKRQRFFEFGRSFSEENHGDKRFVQHDELKFALRSAYVNIPWVNHIYIVTDQQIPTWLRGHAKVTVIDHSEIIPSNLLPTFASTTIELFLDKIPHLAEHFIYSNDDMFFARPLTPDDFFSPDGKPLVWLYPAKKLTYGDAKRISCDKTRDDWDKTLVNAWLMYVDKRKILIPFYTPAHSIDSYTKTLFKKIKNDYPELSVTNTMPFRTGERVSRLLFSYEMVFTYGCELVERKKTNFLARVQAKVLGAKDYVAVSRERLDKLRRDITIFKPKTFCFNNISADNKGEAVAFLEALWPNPAPWEK